MKRATWLGIGSLLLLFSCAGKQDPLPVGGEEVVVPYQEFDSTTLYFYDGSIKKWRLETSYMRKNLDDSGELLVVPVVLTLYDSTGQTGTRVVADSGNSDTDMEQFYIWGNVLVTTDDGMVIRSESLHWKKAARKVYSEDFVQIETSQGDLLRGKGLDAREDFSQWSLKENVSGAFPDFENRAGGDEELFE